MANEKVIIMTKGNFDDEVQKSDIPVLVDFWAPWCGPCRLVGPIIDELAEDLSGKVKVGKINVDDEGELASKFRVMSIPTIILFKNGQIAEKIVGAKSKAEFVEIINNSLK